MNKPTKTTQAIIDFGISIIWVLLPTAALGQLFYTIFYATTKNYLNFIILATAVLVISLQQAYVDAKKTGEELQNALDKEAQDNRPQSIKRKKQQ